MVNKSRRDILFPNVTDQEWNDWKWQVRNRIETLDQLKQYIKLTPEEEEGVRKTLSTLRMAITPYYLALIDQDNPHCPRRRQAIPTAAETHKAAADAAASGPRTVYALPALPAQARMNTSDDTASR